MRTETVTLTNMCMVYDDAGNVLVQDKVDKKVVRTYISGRTY